jgi:hypothetical protein
VIDEVRIELPSGIVSIPSRDALLEQLQTRNSIANVPDVRHLPRQRRLEPLDGSRLAPVFGNDA